MVRLPALPGATRDVYNLLSVSMLMMEGVSNSKIYQQSPERTSSSGTNSTTLEYPYIHVHVQCTVYLRTIVHVPAWIIDYEHKVFKNVAKLLTQQLIVRLIIGCFDHLILLALFYIVIQTCNRQDYNTLQIGFYITSISNYVKQSATHTL